ncbi:MAG: molybdopterin molybdotransferase MoeA [Verrucomicrobia bacterium]|nr:MAG: molybdopterin molybdotransferase MoeA [Verrucomicrobiota bacterium]
MLEYEVALDRLLASLAPASPVSLPIHALANGPAPRFLAADLTSPVPLPLADNSAMDGYAVRAADTRSPHATLQLVGSIAAGSVPSCFVGPGQAARIFTGAPLPPGADAVVMQEDTETDPARPGTVRILDPAKPWENVRFAGEDVRLGAIVGRVGDPLSPTRLALLGATGLREVPVFPQPRVALIATGSELAAPGAAPRPGSIHESNLLPLELLVRSAGGLPVASAIVPDDRNLLADAIRRAADIADIVLTIGGASVGEHDLVKPCAVDAGFEIDFWKLALKPGKPFFVGRRGNVHLLGVPGNPVSAFVTTVLMVQPAVRRLAGARDPRPPTSPAFLGAALSNPDGRRHFVRVAVDRDGTARSAGVQASHALASLAQADGLVDVPPRTTLAAGQRIDAIRW